MLNVIELLNKYIFKEFPLEVVDKDVNGLFYTHSENSVFSVKFTGGHMHIFYHDHELSHMEVSEFIEEISNDEFNKEYYLRIIITRLIRYGKYQPNYDEIVGVVKKLSKGTHTFFNYVTILNESGITKDNPLVYDQHGFCASANTQINNSYMLSTETQNGIEYVEFSFNARTIYSFKPETQDLKTLSNDVRLAMIEHFKRENKRLEVKISENNSLGEYYEKL